MLGEQIVSFCDIPGFWAILGGNEMENQAALFEELIRKTSHDVRTPLTSIAGFADLIAEDATVPNGPREFAGIIKEEVKKLAQTLEEFFDKIKSEDQNDLPS